MDANRWQRISRLCHEALERPVDQRDAFLDASCQGDAALRGEVASRLANEASAESFLNKPAAVGMDALLTQHSEHRHDGLEPGVKLGAYQIDRPLGRGGMGVVFLAHDTTLHRQVALKVLESPADSGMARARLLREARNAAALNHPNICTVYEVREADGRAYIAMEYVDGRSLSDRLAESALPLDEAVRYGIEAADALAHAHEHGVIHRDLKAANAMVTTSGRLKLVDFGLARREDPLLTDATTMASLAPAGVAMGTPYAMAPEQVCGNSADPRTDIWALGVLLYEMASGAKPFDAPTTPELFSLILRDVPAPLSKTVPAELKAIIERCLDKEPGRRYQRAGEVRAALEASQTGAVASRVSSWAVLAPRARWLVAASLLTVVLAFAGVTIWRNVSEWDLPASRQGLSGNTGNGIRSIAVLPLENLSGDSDQEYFVEGMHEALVTDLAQIGLEKVIAKRSSDAFKGTKKPLRDVARELGVEGLITGSVMRTNDRIRVTTQLVRADSGVVVWANRYERNAQDVLSLQSELVSAIAREVQATITPEQSARLAVTRRVDPAAQDLYLKGRSSFASFTNSTNTKYLDAAVAQFEQAIQIDPTYAPSYAALSWSYQTASMGSWRPPKDTFPKARAAALKAVELDDHLAASHAALAGVFLWFDWNWTGAASEIQRALQLNPDSVDALTQSQTYLTLVSGQVDEAAQTSQRILDLDPLNPFSRVQPIWVALFSRRYDESIARAKTLVEMQPNNPMGPWFLATAYAAKGMRPEVVTECDKVMKLLAGAYVMQAIAECVSELGMVGETAQARRLLQRLEQPPSGIWLDPAPMGDAYAGLGDVTRAVEWYQRGLEERSPNMIYLNVNAAADSVRRDPRFQALLRQMNFPR